MKQTSVTCLVVIVLLAAVGLARGGQKDEKDAPASLIKAAEFLEEKPFDKDAKNIRAWAINWIITTDKVSVKFCSLLVSGIDKNYKYSPEILAQYTIGMAAFKLSSPEKAKDENAVQFSGINSALTAYSAMLKEQPKARNAFLDDLEVKSRDGSLPNYLSQNNCKDKK
jgi:hypothetical protein